ncbi:MAG: hypothetical protein RJQ14_12285 [Marinoscillum sp.]
MKTKTTSEKKIDAVKMMRDIRNKIDRETEGMTFKQLKHYYENNETENRKQASREQSASTNAPTATLETSVRTSP